LVDEDGNPVVLDDVEKEGDGELGDEGDAVRGERIEEPSEAVKDEVRENGDGANDGEVKTPVKRKRAAKVAVTENEEADAETKTKPKAKRGKKVKVEEEAATADTAE
jgi:hypothetical protein